MPRIALLLPAFSVFSEIETRVLLQIGDTPALSREEIARRIKVTPDGRLRGILSTLGQRGVLQVTNDGYRLACAPSAREGFKAALLVSLEEGQNGRNGQ
jgi:hypothetical protein